MNNKAHKRSHSSADLNSSHVSSMAQVNGAEQCVGCTGENSSMNFPYVLHPHMRPENQKNRRRNSWDRSFKDHVPCSNSLPKQNLSELAQFGLHLLMHNGVHSIADWPPTSFSSTYSTASSLSSAHSSACNFLSDAASSTRFRRAVEQSAASSIAAAAFGSAERPRDAHAFRDGASNTASAGQHTHCRSPPLSDDTCFAAAAAAAAAPRSAAAARLPARQQQPLEEFSLGHGRPWLGP